MVPSFLPQGGKRRSGLSASETLVQIAAKVRFPPTATDERYRRIVRNERICILEIFQTSAGLWRRRER